MNCYLKLNFKPLIHNTSRKFRTVQRYLQKSFPENIVVTNFATTIQKQQDMENKIEIFKSKDNSNELQVALDIDTVWLSQEL